MPLPWSPEAKQAMARVAFFVRRRVRRRVEAEARQDGVKLVTLERCLDHFMKHYRAGPRFGDLLNQTDLPPL